MKKIIYLAMLVFGLSVFIVSCKHDEKHNEKHEQESSTSLGAEKADLAMNAEYQCPMDCENGKTYDKEGECPECKMALKKVEKAEGDDQSENHDDHEGHGHN